MPCYDIVFFFNSVCVCVCVCLYFLQKLNTTVIHDIAYSGNYEMALYLMKNNWLNKDMLKHKDVINFPSIFLFYLCFCFCLFVAISVFLLLVFSNHRSVVTHPSKFVALKFTVKKTKKKAAKKCWKYSKKW